jgi:hypothetical protein
MYIVFLTVTRVKFLYRGLAQLLGIVVGHLYFFLMFKYPQDFGGATWLRVPAIL